MSDNYFCDGVAVPHVGAEATRTRTWWQTHFARWFLLGVLVGAISGGTALALYYLMAVIRSISLGPLGFGEYPPSLPRDASGLAFLAIAALAGLSSGLLTELAPEARGSGIDNAIMSYHRAEGAIRRIVAPVKLVASAIVMGAGLSAGDEGPIAQTTAGFVSWISDALGLRREDRRKLVGIAIGTGIGTIFKTPIGGAFLASEILYRRDFEYELIFPAFVASAVGYSIFGAVTGYGPIFGFYTAPFDPSRLPLYVLLGVLCGAIAIVYLRAYNATEDAFTRSRIPRWLRPAIGGLAAGAVALAFPEVMGTGTSWTAVLLSPTGVASLGLVALVLLPFAKIAATSLTVGSGGSGGVFAPGLFIGAATGLTFGELMRLALPSIVASPIPFAIVGMLAVFGAAGKLPISVTVMVVEMTGSLQLLPAELLAVTIAYIISGPASIYRSQRTSRSSS
ncbi:MAG: chloride channel protein [Conexivisphaera sp.]